ncbi:unnamed protein product [Larinioides sclopetarius]|uniref:HTH OST-type domain-containing protein n=1 Tax=Larinioides sclopetarius TaxID=280406 RepID=A0AAV1ZJA0_9ARAC
MDKEDLKKSTCINLRCVTQSSKGGVPLNQLQNDYRLLLGTPIPYKDLGYSSLENFLRDIPEVICLKKIADGSLIAEGVADASTAHIAKLISKQKSTKKSKSGSSKPTVVIRTWGSSGKTNSYQKMKTPLKEFNSFKPGTLYRKHEQNSKPVHLTPAQQELKKSVLINLRSVVQSCKDGVPLNRLQQDYRKFLGSNIPFEKLGYSTLYEFIRSIPDVINLKVDVNEQFIATGVVNETTAHLFSNSVKPKPSKSVSPPNESSISNRPTLQITSPQRAESPSFFKLPQNTMELSDINSVLKHAPAKKKPLKAAKPVISCKENSALEVSLPKTNITSTQNQNKIAEKIKNQIKIANLSPLVWMNFILYGPSTIESLRKEILSFYGFPFSKNSKEWEEKIKLISQFNKETLHQCLYLLRIEFDVKDSKKSLQYKLINFLASYTEESGTNTQETEQEDNEF